MGAFTRTARDAIVRLSLDLPGEPVNKITRAVRHELDPILNELERDDTVRAVVLISGKAGSFIAGADIDEFVALASRSEAEGLVRGGQHLVNRLANLGKPVVAAIDGACLGGGMEVALACSYRVAATTSKTTIGLPEVQLGIIPAAGGCQRLPRLIGAQRALELILTGKTVSVDRAKHLGIVDETVHPSILDRVAMSAARRLADGWRPRRRGRGGMALVLESNPLGRAVLFSMSKRKVLARTRGHYPAPITALEAVAHGLKRGIEAGLDREAESFADLAVGAVSRKLVQIFFATTALKKDTGAAPTAQPPRDVQNVAIVGAGFMGAGIAGVTAANARVDVRLRDSDLDRVAKGLEGARALLKNRRSRKRITRYEYQRLERLVSGGVDWAGFARADVVIEAVYEDLEVKRKVFRDLESHVRPECVVASNTSTIPIERIAAVMEHPERVVGMHFFSPVEKMPLLEVIVTETTAANATATAVALGRRMGKTVIVVRDRPGFWVNRILGPYLNEAGWLLLEGVRVGQLDKSMTRFGFPVGPITLLDEVGLDVAHKASLVLHEAFGDRMRPMGGIGRLVEDGRLGRKAGRGFYRYEGGERRAVEESIYGLVEAQPSVSVRQADIQPRLVYSMLNEAVHALSEGVVRCARDADLGAIYGIGYPPFRGGPFRYLDDIGAANAVDTLERLREQYGERFAPAARLVQMAEAGERFYADG